MISAGNGCQTKLMKINHPIDSVSGNIYLARGMARVRIRNKSLATFYSALNLMSSGEVTFQMDLIQPMTFTFAFLAGGICKPIL